MAKNRGKYLSDCFKKEPNEICSHLSEIGPKGRFFLAPKKLENYSVAKVTGKEKQKERGRRKEAEKRKENPWLVYTV